MKRFKKYNDLAPAREEFDKFCLSHPCGKCRLFPLHPANESNKNLGCFGSWLNEEIDEDQTADGQEVKQSKRGTGDAMTKTYIDADQLYKCETCVHDRSGGCDTYCDHGESYRPAFNKLRKITNVQEIKRGKWKHGQLILNRSVCSCCKWITDDLDTNMFKFCPNCGAKMDDK